MMKSKTEVQFIIFRWAMVLIFDHDHKLGVMDKSWILGDLVLTLKKYGLRVDDARKHDLLNIFRQFW